MEILNINFENKTVREYDNMGAHNAAKLMMNSLFPVREFR